MMTVNEVSRLSGVSIRTLHYYDEIGLLSPAVTTASGYRLYDDTSLERLQQILLFRELEFPLKQIRTILGSPNFDRGQALEQQITLLTLKKERMEHLIDFARQIQKNGGNTMSFQAFDTKKIDDYAKEAKKRWGETDAYQEFSRKTADYTPQKHNDLSSALMAIFSEFGEVKEHAPEDPAVQALVRKLQDFITANYYTCTKPILAGLGKMYAVPGEMRENIDAAAGKGTAQFASAAIAVYCAEQV